MVTINPGAASIAYAKAVQTTQAMRAEQLANNDTATENRRNTERTEILRDQRIAAEEFAAKAKAYRDAAQQTP